MEYDIHTVLDFLTLGATAWVIYTLRMPLKDTYQAEQDSVQSYYVVSLNFSAQAHTVISGREHHIDGGQVWTEHLERVNPFVNDPLEALHLSFARGSTGTFCHKIHWTVRLHACSAFEKHVNRLHRCGGNLLGSHWVPRCPCGNVRAHEQPILLSHSPVAARPDKRTVWLIPPVHAFAGGAMLSSGSYCTSADASPPCASGAAPKLAGLEPFQHLVTWTAGLL